MGLLFYFFFNIWNIYCYKYYKYFPISMMSFKSTFAFAIYYIIESPSRPSRKHRATLFDANNFKYLLYRHTYSHCRLKPDPREEATRRDRLTGARLSDRPCLCLGHVAMWQCQCTRHAKLQRATVPTMCNGKQELCTVLFIANVYARLKKLRTQFVIIIYYLYYIFLFVFLISSKYFSI